MDTQPGTILSTFCFCLSLSIEDYYYMKESSEQENSPPSAFMEHYRFLVLSLDKVKFKRLVCLSQGLKKKAPNI
ncbi:hypothetical protein KSF_099540 [Reticulibacter mediterranei]|uniref:Uncharacterized protein n=1 Tax=Reticulibacter mediterranei TaxID=2778369 RepID=A0A8J3J354_9CHLR|nr:hypothetical protein KSF_099540 [Reticulibacter mediterranei]